MCEQLNPLSTALNRDTPDINLFLQNRFVYWNRYPGYPFRVNLEGEVCLAYDIIANTDNPVDDVGISYYVDCETPMFPICYYFAKDVSIMGSAIGYSYETIIVYKYGQVGIPHPGYPVECTCLDGWSGVGCQIASCMVPPFNSGNATSGLIVFYENCYINGHGACDNGNPRFCQCLPGFGPSAHYMISIPAFVRNVCDCPSSPSDDPTSSLSTGWIMNGKSCPRRC